MEPPTAQGAAPELLDPTDGALGLLAAPPVAHRHLRALGGESEGDRPTDAP